MWAHETVSRLINLRVCSCAHGCSNLQVAGARLIQMFLCTNFIFIQFLVTLAEKKSLQPQANIVHRKLRNLPPNQPPKPRGRHFPNPPPKRRGPVPSTGLVPFAGDAYSFNEFIIIYILYFVSHKLEDFEKKKKKNDNEFTDLRII